MKWFDPDPGREPGGPAGAAGAIRSRPCRARRPSGGPAGRGSHQCNDELLLGTLLFRLREAEERAEHAQAQIAEWMQRALVAEETERQWRLRVATLEAAKTQRSRPGQHSRARSNAAPVLQRAWREFRTRTSVEPGANSRHTPTTGSQPWEGQRRAATAVGVASARTPVVSKVAKLGARFGGGRASGAGPPFSITFGGARGFYNFF